MTQRYLYRVKLHTTKLGTLAQRWRINPCVMNYRNGYHFLKNAGKELLVAFYYCLASVGHPSQIAPCPSKSLGRHSATTFYVPCLPLKLMRVEIRLLRGPRYTKNYPARCLLARNSLNRDA